MMCKAIVRIAGDAIIQQGVTESMQAACKHWRQTVGKLHGNMLRLA